MKDSLHKCNVRALLRVEVEVELKMQLLQYILLSDMKSNSFETNIVETVVDVSNELYFFMEDCRSSC